MKTLILLLISTCCCFGQGVKEIVIKSQRFNEPPTIPAPASYKLDFKKKGNGDFVATEIEEHSKRIKKIKIKKEIVLAAEDVDRTASWIHNDKSVFQLEEFNPNLLTLSGDIKQDLVIKADSFRLCNTFDNLKSISIGGTKLDVLIRFENGTEKAFNFESGDFGTSDFDLQSFLILFPLLEDKLPEDLSPDFFNEVQLVKVLEHYLDAIKCEELYYKEFISTQPDRTPQENRMKVGWDFEKYMEKREKAVGNNKK